MPRLRLALAQVDTVVGDLAANVARARAAVAEAAASGADLVALPEMCLTGYPVEDLALRPSFLAASQEAVEELARLVEADGHGEVAVVVGYLDQDVDLAGQDVQRTGLPSLGSQNCAAVLHRGQVVARYAKNHLPNAGVFDEQRIFAPGTHGQRVHLRGVDVALLVCEDLWRDGGVTAQLAEAEHDPGLVLVINASPYEQGKHRVRYELCRSRAAETGCTVAYVNLVGGQDELVFDGQSLVVAPDGEVLARAPQFVEHVLVVDLDLPEGASEAGPGPALRPGRPRRGAAPRAARAAAAGAGRAAGGVRGGLPRARARACATTPARTASPTSSSACPAASTPPWWPRSPSTRSAPSTSTRWPCPPGTPPRARSPTRPTSPPGRARATGSSTSSPWSTPSSAACR